MEAEVYAQYQTVIADCGIEIEQTIFVDISAGMQKPQTKVCGFSLWRLLGPANLRCLFNLDQPACFYIVKYNRKSEYWTLPADDF